MALTSVELAIDQRQPGWGGRALAQGARALQQSGCHAMAAELERSGQAADPTALLSRFVRLRIRPGTAPGELRPALLHGGPERHSAYAGDLPDAVRLDWTFRPHGNLGAAPMVSPLGDRVLLGSLDQNLYCLDAASGDALWSRDLREQPWSAPAIVGERILIGGSRYFSCLSLKDGGELWKKQGEGSGFDSSPAVVGERVLAGCRDHHLYCFDLQSGERLWRLEAFDWVSSPPAVSGERVLACDDKGNCWCADLQSGKFLWTQQCGRRLRAAPAVVGERVLVPGEDYYLHCLALDDGRQLWRTPTGGALTPAVAVSGDRVVVGSADHHLYCFDLQSGAELWCYRTGHEIHSPPAIVGERVVVGSRDADLHCVELSDGRPVWRHASGGEIHHAPAIAPDGRILYVSNNAELRCLKGAE